MLALTLNRGEYLEITDEKTGERVGIVKFTKIKGERAVIAVDMPHRYTVVRSDAKKGAKA